MVREKIIQKEREKERKREKEREREKGKEKENGRNSERRLFLLESGRQMSLDCFLFTAYHHQLKSPHRKTPRCNTLQHAAPRCTTLQGTATPSCRRHLHKTVRSSRLVGSLNCQAFFQIA